MSDPTTGAAYGDKNGERLREACAQHGWTSYQFAGFHQWRAIGRVVRKGEHGTRIALIVPKRVAGAAPEAAHGLYSITTTESTDPHKYIRADLRFRLAN